MSPKTKSRHMRNGGLMDITIGIGMTPILDIQMGMAPIREIAIGMIRLIR